jgi:hypothetical protein
MTIKFIINFNINIKNTIEMTGRKLLFSHSGMFIFEHYYHTCREWNGKTDTKKDYRIKNAAAKKCTEKDSTRV